jgi:ABC-type polar amino acid transport system ATPase subunit
MGFAREIAHRVVFMDEGRIVETGSPGEIFDRPRNAGTQDFVSNIF